MSRRITAQVSAQVLQQLFKEYGIWRKIRGKTLTTVQLHPVPSVTFRNGTSRILLHFDANGKHVASTHRIMNEKTGAILHWDEKGMQLDDLWLERA